MKIGIVLLLLVFGQFAYAEGDSVCEIVNYESIMQPFKDNPEVNDYMLEQCQDGDVLRIVGQGNNPHAASKLCKLATIVPFPNGTVACEYRKEARVEVMRPSKKEWKQMKKNSEK